MQRRSLALSNIVPSKQPRPFEHTMAAFIRSIYTSSANKPKMQGVQQRPLRRSASLLPATASRRRNLVGTGSCAMLQRESSEPTTGPSTWEEYAGNFILRPRVQAPQSWAHPKRPDLNRPASPKALIHFLGGAFAGAAPQIFYRWLLEQLALEGYVVVSTPYRLSFDHLSTVDEVLTRFSAAAGMLALDYGEIPVIGMGHSLGALLQTISGSLFGSVDGNRAINVLIAFNNRRAENAIPLFREFIAPTVINVAQTDDLADALERLLVDTPATLDTIFDTFIDALFPSARNSALLTLLRQSRSIGQQIPPLFAEVADGAVAFNPDPSENVDAIRSMYKVRQTLLVSFRNDILDDTSSLYRVLDASRGATLIRLNGTHLTPCTQDLLDIRLFQKNATISNSQFRELDSAEIFRESIRRIMLREALLLKNSVVTYLDRALEAM